MLILLLRHWCVGLVLLAKRHGLIMRYSGGMEFPEA
jgi:hypothetical protein